MRSQLDFIHEFVPGAFNQTLLLLHGTGGNKRGLLPLEGELDFFISGWFGSPAAPPVRRASLVDR